MHWIVEPFLVDLALTGWMAPFGLVGLAGGLGLFWAAAFWGAQFWRGTWALAALVILWALAELARGYVLTGFPWGLVGYLWTASWGIQWVSVIGPYGLTAATLALAALAAQALRAGAALPGASALCALAVALLGGLALAGQLQAPPEAAQPRAAEQPAPRPIVRLIQPNAAQRDKWNPDLIPTFFERQVALTGQGPTPALVIWPETALPMLLENAQTAFDIMSEAANGAPILTGLQRFHDGGFRNTAVLLDAQGLPDQIYDKHHLVPFGEYMPLSFLFARIQIGGLAARTQGGYVAGPGAQLLDLGPLGTALPLICYEAVFPQDVNAAPVRPDMILHLTNDAWFGRFAGPYQHLAQARIRAIEQGLPVLRAANTGVSAVIDGKGRILASLPLNTAGALDHAIPPPLAPTIYSRTGDLPVLLLLCALLAGAFARRLRVSH